MQTYFGYQFKPRTDCGVDVCDPRFPNRGPVYTAASSDAAKRWVKAYRDGVVWAIKAVLS
ncbi:hypothetical protein ACQKO5_18950 [Novosphingobium subterraneum]|uniref:hypothetical protein n=1 Tax=Novosphingobium subterraneum TaxID=48936 RepID=UPI003D08EF39